MKRKSKAKKEKSIMLGLGLDNKDGHKRITQGDGFVIAGGSKETHEKMQDQILIANDILGNKGKDLATAHPDEAFEAMQRAIERTS